MALSRLFLCYTEVTDAGCTALAAALDSGALPALERLHLHGIPASDTAQDAVHEARDTLNDEESYISESGSESEEGEEEEGDEDDEEDSEGN